MERNDFENLANNNILEFADRLENYCNEIAFVVSNGSEDNLIEYTHRQFEKIDSDFLTMCTRIFADFTQYFDDEADKELFDECAEKLEAVKDRIIEMKYNIMNIFAQSAIA